MRRAIKGTRIAVLGAILAGLPLLVGCGGTKQPEVAQQSQKVQVSVSDKNIEMPASLPAGKTLFTVTNTGKREHSFGIAGPAGDKVLEKTLKPGESGALELRLDSGTYRIYCPVDQEKGEGTQIALVVLPETLGSKS